MLLDTWPYYYVEKAKENLQWKYSLVCILIILSIIFVLLIVVKIFRYFQSKCGKSKIRLVEILAVSDLDMFCGRADKKINVKSKVLLKEYMKKKGRKLVLFMDTTGIREGDVGWMEYKGQKGICFIKKDSLIEGRKVIYYRFGFKNNTDTVSKKKERKVRKYW